MGDRRPYSQQCPRCKGIFGADFVAFGPNMEHRQYCPGCTEIIRRANRLEEKLNRADFSFDADDEAVARRINAILAREGSTIVLKADEEALKHLIERRVADEKRRLQILKELERLQQEKGD